MKIVVTGASGFIGRALTTELAQDHTVVALTRRPDRVSGLFERSVEIMRWDPARLDGWERCLEDADAVVHLAGTNLATGRWTERFKADIVNSRIDSSRVLLQAIETQSRKPAVVISSAIGFYGSCGDEPLDEASDLGQGFLAEVCQKNEAIVPAFEALTPRVVVIRTGIVLGASGGAYPKMAMPFRFFIGGHLGPGSQWVSWISLMDEVLAIKFLLEHENLNGVFNLCAPQPQRNRSFMQILARNLKRPCCLPMPAFALKMLFGQMADELFLSSQRVYPKRLLAEGFNFRHAELKDALVHIAT